MSGTTVCLFQWTSNSSDTLPIDHAAEGKYLVPTTYLKSFTRLPASLTTGRDYTHFISEILEGVQSLVHI